jgi:3-isopropylmalate dehydrogenase
MVKKHILIVPGDGIGQEVTAVGKKVLEKIAAKFGHEFTYDEALIGYRGNRGSTPSRDFSKNESF